METRIFITGGTGFVGKEVLRVLKEDYPLYKVTVLSRNPPSNSEPNVEFVKGDLLNDKDTEWKSVAKQCNYILHLAQPTMKMKIFGEDTENFKMQAQKMDKQILSLVSEATALTRMVYAASPGQYGNTGSSWINEETTTPSPVGRGALVAESMEKIAASSQLPIVMAFPGFIYGNGCWLKKTVLDNLAKGKGIVKMAWDKYTSYIHVEDCARALVFLLHNGKPGQKYFLVDNDPVTREEFFQVLQEALGTPLKLQTVPESVLKFQLGASYVETMTSQFKMGNYKLKNLGYQLKYPTIKQGLPDVLEQYKKNNQIAASGSGLYTTLAILAILAGSGYYGYCRYRAHTTNVESCN